MIPSELISKFQYIEPYLNLVQVNVRDKILHFCEENNFAYSGRTKNLRSLSEKIETGRFENWSKLDDLFACSIIIPTLFEEEVVLKFLTTEFETVAVKKRGSSQKDPNVFRFDSTRFIGKLREFSKEENPEIKKIQFEVQIRTAFEHAWVTATHSFAYKGKNIDWKFLRAAAQIKATVEQTDLLIVGVDEYCRLITEQFWPEIYVKKEIQEFFANEIEQGRIPKEMEPPNWTRFCQNVWSLLIASNAQFIEDPKTNTAIYLKMIKAEIDNSSASGFPKSISLIQFIIGALTKMKIINPKKNSSYIPLITQQLIDLYPDVSEFSRHFDFE
jgi:ppGpp synthetase/RelA/SpoT-type nucleotidyltranferase